MSVNGKKDADHGTRRMIRECNERKRSGNVRNNNGSEFHVVVKISSIAPRLMAPGEEVTPPQSPTHTPRHNEEVEEEGDGEDANVVDEAPVYSGRHKSRGHPFARVAHVLFKILPVAVYLTCTSIWDNFVVICVVSVLLLAIDFWVTKNVTGRLLVGLRWHNDVQSDGTSVWVFESLEDHTVINATDRRTFWIALSGFPVIWAALALTALLTLQLSWLLIVAMALLLSGANGVGYIKCKRDAKQKVRRFVAGQTQRLMRSMA